MADKGRGGAKLVKKVVEETEDSVHTVIKTGLKPKGKAKAKSNAVDVTWQDSDCCTCECKDTVEDESNDKGSSCGTSKDQVIFNDDGTCVDDPFFASGLSILTWSINEEVDFDKYGEKPTNRHLKFLGISVVNPDSIQAFDIQIRRNHIVTSDGLIHVGFEG